MNVSIQRERVREILAESSATLGLTQVQIGEWCGVRQPAIAKWQSWADDIDCGENGHAPTEQHFESLRDLSREARCVKYLQMSPKRWRELAWNGHSWQPVWNRVPRYICAHADDYPPDDGDRAVADLAALLLDDDPDTLTITVRRGKLSERTHARCFTQESGSIPRAWVVVVDSSLSEQQFCDEALREIQAHVLKPQPSADDLPIASPLNGTDSSQPGVTADDRSTRTFIEGYQSWVEERSKRQTGEKRAIASHVVTHILQRKAAVQIASGTTESALMDEIKAKGIEDLQICTNNLQVLAKGRRANLGSMTITLTGGMLNESIESLIGPDAAEMVSAKDFMPHAVFFGAAGLTFRDGLWVSYAFHDELATQYSFATRPTIARVLMADHTKLGNTCGRRAPVTIESMLETARKCYVVSTFHESAADTISREAEGLKRLLLPLVTKDEYLEKDFLFRLVNMEGTVVKEYSLGALRRREWN